LLGGVIAGDLGALDAGWIAGSMRISLWR
jgi:hypothetical protein